MSKALFILSLDQSDRGDLVGVPTWWRNEYQNDQINCFHKKCADEVSVVLNSQKWFFEDINFLIEINFDNR